MAKSRVVFRVDGSTQIGLGHVMRCRALADILRPGHPCVFAAREIDPQVTDMLRKAGFAVEHHMGEVGSAEDTAWLLDEVARSGDVIVLDGYHFGPEYQRAVKARGYKLVCIDDLHQGHFFADVVINHGGARPEAYEREPGTRLCLGPRYALLRPPFLEAMKESRVAGEPDSALICFGGSDPHDLTRKLLRACAEVPGLRRIEVVVGSAYRDLAGLREECAKSGPPAVSLHAAVGADELARLIRGCAFAVTSASTVAYEVCAVKAGLIVCPYVDNQIELAAFLAGSGAAGLCEGALTLTAADLAARIRLLATKESFTLQIRAQAALFAPGVEENLRSLFL